MTLPKQPPRRRPGFKHALGTLFGWAGWKGAGAFVTAVTALAALFFSTASLRSTEKQYELARTGQLAEQFTASVEQLGSDQVEIQLGGIYSLEQLAAQDASYRHTAYEVLAAFVRTNAGLPSLVSSEEEAPCSEADMPPVQVIAAVDVIGRRAVIDDQRIVLGMTCLVGLSTPEGDNFSNVNFATADMRRVFLMGSNFDSGNLSAANFSNAQLYGVQLTNARLSYANFSGAVLMDSNFAGADLEETNLAGAVLEGADLSGAQNLNSADLHDAVYDENTLWPPGFEPPA